MLHFPNPRSVLVTTSTATLFLRLLEVLVPLPSHASQVFPFLSRFRTRKSTNTLFIPTRCPQTTSHAVLVREDRLPKSTNRLDHVREEKPREMHRGIQMSLGAFGAWFLRTVFTGEIMHPVQAEADRSSSAIWARLAMETILSPEI